MLARAGRALPARRRLPNRVRGNGDGSCGGVPGLHARIPGLGQLFPGVAHEILTYDAQEWTPVHAPGPATTFLRADELSLHSGGRLP